jgi:nucleoside-diphosphate-sugar epimerase
VFYTIRKLIERSKVIPLIGGGNQPIQTIAMDNLLLALEKCIREKVTGVYHLAEPRAIPIRELYRCTAEKCHRHPVFVTVPLAPMLILVKVVERLGVALPLGSENILGLKHLRAFDTQPDLHKLGVRLKDFRTSLDHFFS